MDDIVWPPKKPGATKSGPNHNRFRPPGDANADSKPTATPHVEPEATEPVVDPLTSTLPGAAEAQPQSADKPVAVAKPKRRFIYFRHIKMSKKKWALLIIGVLVMLAAAAYGAKTLYTHFRKPLPQPVQAKTVKVEPKVVTEPSRLTGVEISPELNKRPVTGVMIENSTDARPQSGLKDAGIVYEAIAEGGITRFLALFMEAQPDYIGPVRSVRPYYLDFLMPFDAAVAHVGGAPQALSDIKTLHVKDLDQFANSGTYSRVTTRFAPHNVYTDFTRLDALNAQKGYTASAFTGYTRKKVAPSKAPNASKIDLAISASIYNVHYDYDAKTNKYLRYEGGASHTDERSGAQLAPDVVVAMVMDRGIASDGQHTDYATTAGGQVYIFQDGTVTVGSWSKASRDSQFVFTDSSGAVIPLNPGQTWISLVDTSSKITYTP